MEWKDATSYSQGQRGKKEPTAWSVKSGQVGIYVTCGHIYYPSEWIMSCYAIGLKEVRLMVDTKEDAQKKAIEIVIERCSRLLGEAKKIKENENGTN